MRYRLFVLAFAVLAGSLGSTWRAAPVSASAGPDITIECPAIAFQGGSFSCTMGWGSFGADRPTGYQFVITYDSPTAFSGTPAGLGTGMTVTSLSKLYTKQTMWENSPGNADGDEFCPPPQLNAPDAMLPTGYVRSGSGCATLAGPATQAATGLIAWNFLAQGVGPFPVHVVTYGVGGATNGSYTIDQASAPHTPQNFVCVGAMCASTAHSTADNPLDPIVNIAVLTNVAVSKTSLTAAAPLGADATFTLAVTNTSSYSASGVVLTDLVPPGLDASGTTFTGPGAGACGTSGATITCSVGSLAPGATFTVDAHIPVTGSIGSQITNCATVTITEPEPTSDNQSCVTLPVVAAGPDITIAAPPTSVLGESFDVTISNSGAVPHPYRGFQVALVYDPTQLAVNSVFASAAGALIPDPFCAQDPAGTVPAGYAAVVFGCVSIGAPITTTGELMRVSMRSVKPGVNSLHLFSAGNPDNGGQDYGTFTINAADNLQQTNALVCVSTCGPVAGIDYSQAWDAVVRIPAPDLVVTKTALSPTIVAGQTESFVIEVANVSPIQGATGVVLTDSLPGGFVPSSTTFSGPGASTCSIAGGEITCMVGTLAVGGTFNVRVDTASANNGGAADALTNCASAAGNEGDEAPVDNVGCAGVTVAADTDRDGWSDSAEALIGENPNVYCSVMRGDVDYDGTITILDLSAIAAKYIQTVPPAPHRLDQGPAFDNSINILDLARLAADYTRTVGGCP